MKFVNNETGDILSVPPPDDMGASVVRFNNRVVERVTYSDAEDAVTTADGRVYSAESWPRYLVEMLHIGGWDTIQ